ncbi:MAG: MGMT family protein, partial [Tannerella sp.]|nr:MGMT family protein [Tannerella sp.]
MMLPSDKEAFRDAVYEIVRRIPPGRATSYGAIAKAAGFPNLSRMTGRFMKECEHYTTGLPAHRVVNSQGQLSGAETFGYSGQMQQLLEA